MARNNRRKTSCCSFCDGAKQESERLFREGQTLICDLCVDEAVVAKKQGSLHTNIGAACNCGFCNEVTPSAFVRQIENAPLPLAVCEACIDKLKEMVAQFRDAKKLEEALRNPTVQRQTLGMFFRQAADLFKGQGVSYPTAAKFLSNDLDAVRQVYDPKQPVRGTKLSPPTSTEYEMAVVLLRLGGMEGASTKAVLTRPALRPVRPKPQAEAVPPREAWTQALK